jgi:hypothetical protein
MGVEGQSYRTCFLLAEIVKVALAMMPFSLCPTTPTALDLGYLLPKVPVLEGVI